MDPKTGILLKLAAMLAFTVMSACVKGLDGAIPVGEVVFCRGFFALIPLCLWFIASSERITVPARKNIGSLLAGSSAGLGGMFFGFLALAYLPLVNVTVLSYTTPLFTIMLAALLLGEKVRVYRWSAVLTSFIGVFITLSPNLVFDAASGPTRIDGVAMIGTALALIGALCAAFSSIAVRHLNSIEKPSHRAHLYADGRGRRLHHDHIRMEDAGFSPVPAACRQRSRRRHRPDYHDAQPAACPGLAAGAVRLYDDDLGDRPRLSLHGRSSDWRDHRRRTDSHCCRTVRHVAGKPAGKTVHQGAESASSSVTRFLCSRLSRHNVNKPAATTIDAPIMVVSAGT